MCLKSVYCNYKYISHILPRLRAGQPRSHGLIVGWSEGFFSSQSRSKPVLGQPYSVGTAPALTLVRTNQILSARDPWYTSAILPLLSMITGLTLSSWKPEKSVTSSRRTPDGSSPFHLSYMKLSCYYLQSHSHVNFLCERKILCYVISSYSFPFCAQNVQNECIMRKSNPTNYNFHLQNQ
jgi:hypothetical protein